MSAMQEQLVTLDREQVSAADGAGPIDQPVVNSVSPTELEKALAVLAVLEGKAERAHR